MYGSGYNKTGIQNRYSIQNYPFVLKSDLRKVKKYYISVPWLNKE